MPAGVAKPYHKEGFIMGLENTTRDVLRAINTFCVLSGQFAILLQEKKLRPEDYGQRLLDALSQTIREARQEAGGEAVSQYAAWLEKIHAQFERSLKGTAGRPGDVIPEAWEPEY